MANFFTVASDWQALDSRLLVCVKGNFAGYGNVLHLITHISLLSITLNIQVKKKVFFKRIPTYFIFPTSTSCLEAKHEIVKEQKSKQATAYALITPGNLLLIYCLKWCTVLLHVILNLTHLASVFYSLSIRQPFYLNTLFFSFCAPSQFASSPTTLQAPATALLMLTVADLRQRMRTVDGVNAAVSHRKFGATCPLINKIKRTKNYYNIFIKSG